MDQAVALALHLRLFSLFAAARAVPGLVVPGLVVPGLVGHGLMGLALAAALADQVDWRWVFLALLLVLPVAAALLLPAFARLPPLSTATASPTAPATLTAPHRPAPGLRRLGRHRRGLQAGLLRVTADIGALAAALALAPAGTPLAVLVVASWAVSGLGVGLAFPIL